MVRLSAVDTLLLTTVPLGLMVSGGTESTDMMCTAVICGVSESRTGTALHRLWNVRLNVSQFAAYTYTSWEVRTTESEFGKREGNIVMAQVTDVYFNFLTVITPENKRLPEGLTV